jgi:hypothetical protein
MKSAEMVRIGSGAENDIQSAESALKIRVNPRELPTLEDGK